MPSCPHLHIPYGALKKCLKWLLKGTGRNRFVVLVLSDGALTTVSQKQNDKQERDTQSWRAEAVRPSVPADEYFEGKMVTPLKVSEHLLKVDWSSPVIPVENPPEQRAKNHSLTQKQQHQQPALRPLQIS